MREYIRDITRFINGQRDTYPDMPYGYFDDAVIEEFERIRDRGDRQAGPARTGSHWPKPPRARA